MTPFFADSLNERSIKRVRKLSILAAIVIVTVCRSAAADPASDGIVNYYDGEQTSAYVVGTLGAAAAITGAVMLNRPGELSHSLGWTWIGFGGVEAVGAIAYTLQVHHEIHHYEALLAN